MLLNCPSSTSAIHERRWVVRIIGTSLASLLFLFPASASSGISKPNIVVILADDLGYGDLSIQGHPVIRTPNIDQLAREGQRWTSFYASAPLCNPSRMALMTGRMPIRIHGSGKNEVAPIPDGEITLAEVLRAEGYATGYIGKWGLSGLTFDYQGSHPIDQGFDDFFGLATSNDVLPEGVERTYDNIRNAKRNDLPVSVYRQREVIEHRVDQSTLTKRYTEESVNWIRSHKQSPFFLFVAHSMPHVPIFRSQAFEGHSRAGLYGDVIEEIDWSVAQIIKALRVSKVADRTLVIFSSDNGPWLTYYDLGGSPGALRDGKLTAWEGGFRVPAIFWWPGKVKPAVINDLGANVDLMRTITSLTGAALAKDRAYDSIDLSSTLLKGTASPRNAWFFYGVSGNLWAARVGQYKLVLESQDSMAREEQFIRGYSNRETHSPPLLFDLSTDISERLNVADRHPEIVLQIQKAIRSQQESPSVKTSPRHE